jgi:DNA-binding transcriptional MerR regulator
VYDDAHQDLQFIRYCRGLDMSLDEVRILLDFKDRPPEDCTDVNALIEEHIDHVTTRIKELRSLEKATQDLRYQCPVARRVTSAESSMSCSRLRADVVSMRANRRMSVVLRKKSQRVVRRASLRRQ